MKLVLLAAALVALVSVSPAAADPLRPLKRADAAVYAEAFSAVRSGEFTSLPTLLRRLSDTCLRGRLEYLALMRPDRPARAADLARWLKRHASEPDADKVFALATRRANQEGVSGGDKGRAFTLVKPAPPIDAVLAASRDSYYKTGDLNAALRLAETSGERWIAGLAAYRLERFSLAQARFASLAADPAQSDWRRSGAAFWAARAALAGGSPDEASRFLKLAAATPLTFYGQIAARRLGRSPAPGLDAQALSTQVLSTTALPAAAPSPPDAPAATLGALVRRDPRARRAAAFVQIGDTADAQRELKTALLAAGSVRERELWRSLAARLGAAPVRIASPGQVDPDAYPRPVLTPVGGFTVDPALVYAIIRQESSFNTAAASSAGAFGLMQLTAASAAVDAGLRPDQMDVGLLLDADTNVRLGQDHLTHLLSLLRGDLLQTVMAYNAGPKTIARVLAAMPGADGLLLLESLPGAETRDYAQKVLSNYWIYQGLMDQKTPTLDALAEDRPGLLTAQAPMADVAPLRSAAAASVPLL